MDPGRFFSENSPFVPGVAEAGDEFGSALASDWESLLIGIPGEDVGSIVDAGAVLHLNRTTFIQFTENSPGVPGVAEPGDRFGSVLHLSYDSVGRLALVGIPGEDVGSAADAGAVAVWEMDTGDWFVVSQNSNNVPGGVEASDQFGASLAGPASTNSVVVGSPGESFNFGGQKPGAGTVHLISTVAFN